MIGAKDVVIAALGASGWAVTVVKMLMDCRGDARKERDDQRKENEEQRKALEAQSKLADQIAPFIRELNDADYLGLYKKIKSAMNGEIDPSSFTADDIRKLMNYPGKLEDIGALMLAGKFSRSQVYEYFGEEILACSAAQFLWANEDLHYWKVFKLLVKAMEEEHLISQRLTKGVVKL